MHYTFPVQFDANKPKNCTIYAAYSMLFFVVTLFANWLSQLGHAWQVVGAVGSALGGAAAVVASVFSAVQWFISRYVAAAKLTQEVRDLTERIDELRREFDDQQDSIRQTVRSTRDLVQDQMTRLDGFAGDQRRMREEIRISRQVTEDLTISVDEIKTKIDASRDGKII